MLITPPVVTPVVTFNTMSTKPPNVGRAGAAHVGFQEQPLELHTRRKTEKLVNAPDRVAAVQRNRLVHPTVRPAATLAGRHTEWRRRG